MTWTHRWGTGARFATSCICIGAATGCSSTGPSPPAPTLPSVQSAVVCPAPPRHAPVANPLRHFSAAPSHVIASGIGYCAYISTSAGIASIRLRPEHAPNAVNDFVFLAQQGFYDGLSVTDVCPDPADTRCPPTAPITVAGDPTGTGGGGPGYDVPADAVVGAYLFGSVAMFGPNPSSLGSQFFISRGDSRSLPPIYDIFGQLTDGIPALAALQRGATIAWVAIEPTSA